MTVVILDNYDSFTYNLYQMVQALTEETVTVYRNDAIAFDALRALNPSRVILSPGPGHPDTPGDFGVCGEVLARQAELGCPVLGDPVSAWVRQPMQTMLAKVTVIGCLGLPLLIDAPLPAWGQGSLILNGGSRPSFTAGRERTAFTTSRPIRSRDSRWASSPTSGHPSNKRGCVGFRSGH